MTLRSPLLSPRIIPDPYGISRRSQQGVQSSLLLTTLQRGAVQYFTGFETGDTREVFSASSGDTVQGTIVRSGAYALSIGSVNGTILATGLASAKSCLRIYVYLASASATSLLAPQTALGAPSLSQAILKLTSGANLQLADGLAGGGVAALTGSTVVSLNQWHRLEFMIDNAAGGIVRVYLDGSLEIDTTHLSATANTDLWICLGLPSPNQVIYDDALIVTGLIPPGPGQVIARQGKAGPPTYDSWTKNGGGTAASVWSDTPFNTATNATNAISGNAQTMLIAPFSQQQAGKGPEVVLPTDGINACKTAVIGKAALASSGKIIRIVNGVETDTAFTYTASDKYFDDGIWTTTPAGLDNALQAGVSHALDINLETIEDVWVMVDFATASPIDTNTPIGEADWPLPQRPYYRVNQVPQNPLLTTLASSRLTPFIQSDWPNFRAPQWPTALRSIDPQSALTALFPSSRLTPFFQSDWPSPRGYVYPTALRIFGPASRALLNVQNVTADVLARAPYYANQRRAFWRSDLFGILGAPPIVLLATIPIPVPGVDVSNPMGAPYPLSLRGGDPTNPLALILASNRVIPFNQLDWPTPRGPIYAADLRTFLDQIAPALSTAGPAPFNLLNWPNPMGYVRSADLGTLLQTASLSLKSVPVGNPFHVLDWPLPSRGAAGAVSTFIQSRPFYYIDVPTSAGVRIGYPRLTRDATHYQVVDAINRILGGNLELPVAYEIVTPSDNFAVNVPPNVKALILKPASALTTGLIVMATTAIDQDSIRVTSTKTITNLSVQAGSGQTILNAPTSLAGGASFSYVYNASGKTWYRLQ